MCWRTFAGRHRSVLMAGLLEHFLISRGLHARARHLCSGAWGTCATEIPHARHAVQTGGQQGGRTPTNTSRTSSCDCATSTSFTTQGGGPTSRCQTSPQGGPQDAMLPPCSSATAGRGRPPLRGPVRLPPPPKTGGITLVDAASRARSQGAPQTARVLEARQQHQTAEHRAQSRVRFDEAMAGIGVQNVRSSSHSGSSSPAHSPSCRPRPGRAGQHSPRLR